MENWLPNFENIILQNPINQKAEERRRQAKEDAGIITANDKQETQIETNKQEARNSALRENKYQSIKNQWSKEDALPIAQEIISDLMPFYNTYKFAKKAGTSLDRAKYLFSNGYIRPGLGQMSTAIGNFATGIASIYPFTSSAIKEIQNIKNGLNSIQSNYLQQGPAQTYGKVKYYGPTMGKTTAAKTNPLLSDFDDVVRADIEALAKRKGVTVRDLKINSDPDYIQLINDAVNKWQLNPANNGKTLMISNKVLSNPNKVQFIYDNTPSIPSKESFIRRNVNRGGTVKDSEEWYNALIKENPNLQLDNRFVEIIENGPVQPTISKLTEAERLGIPKGERVPYTTEENIAFRKQINDFASKYGYEPIGEEVTDPEVLERYARSLIKRHNTYFRGIHDAPNEEVMKYWATHAPGGISEELYISPYKDVAEMYGDPVEILRPYKLGQDRTKWFTEGDFKIASAGGQRDTKNFEGVKGIVDPWNENSDVPMLYVTNELTGRNQKFIPMRISYKPRYGSRNWSLPSEHITGSLNRTSVPFYPNIQFKSGGKLDENFTDFINTLPDNQKPTEDFDVYRYWELNGKPKDFEEAKRLGMYILEDDGLYHAKSVAKNGEEYEWIKSINHPSRGMELMWYEFNPDFKKKYQIQLRNNKLFYTPRYKQGNKINYLRFFK